MYLQTPYFIPDESVLDALRMAALSGVDVRIMMPDRPDHPFVYWAGMSYIRQLLDSGVKAYTYDNGFIHAKTIVIDEVAASVGSANWDVRSFRLNFETNAVMYDASIAKELKERFLKDLDVCSPITIERLDDLPWDKSSGSRSPGSSPRCSEISPSFPSGSSEGSPDPTCRGGASVRRRAPCGLIVRLEKLMGMAA